MVIRKSPTDILSQAFSYNLRDISLISVDFHFVNNLRSVAKFLGIPF